MIGLRTKHPSSLTLSKTKDLLVGDILATAEYIPQEQHLANSPVTKKSPTNGDPAPGADAEFTR